MKRRDLLKTIAASLATAQAQAVGTSAATGRVNTVLGPRPAARLGRTLMHEHILVDFVGASAIAPGRYQADEVFRIALPHLERLKSAGCSTLVECTPDYLGRDPQLLRRLSKASGLNIVTNTGLYGAADDKYVPRFAYSETAEQLAERWIREFEEGIPPSGIHPGFIKIGVNPGPLSAIDAKLVSAAGLTHLRTGLTIACHTGDGVAALAQLHLLKKHGVQPSAWIWVHAQMEKTPEFHRRAADAGAWLEFDGISAEALERHTALVLDMKHRGHLGQVLISQDSGWYHVGEPGGGNFRGYEFLFTEFLPQLRKAGLSEGEILMLVVENPRRALSPHTSATASGQVE